MNEVTITTEKDAVIIRIAGDPAETHEALWQVAIQAQLALESLIEGSVAHVAKRLGYTPPDQGEPTALDLRNIRALTLADNILGIIDPEPERNE